MCWNGWLPMYHIESGYQMRYVICIMYDTDYTLLVKQSGQLLNFSNESEARVAWKWKWSKDAEWKGQGQ